MIHTEWKLAASDGLTLYAREWLPAEREAVGTVCIVHGMGEHSGCYAELAGAFAEAGFAVLAYDQRGHGRSDGRRGHSPSIMALVSDAGLLLEEARTRHPGLPRFLYGHSMGGSVALNCALRLRPGFDGLILSSPWLRLAMRVPALKLRIGRIMARLWPTLPQRTGLKPGDLFRAASGGAAPQPDPLNHLWITPGMFVALEEAGEWALAHARELDTPLLLMHGTADRVTSFEASRELARQVGSRCEFVPWDGGYHELHRDLDKDDVIRHMTRWLKARLRSKPREPFRE